MLCLVSAERLNKIMLLLSKVVTVQKLHSDQYQHVQPVHSAAFAIMLIVAQPDIGNFIALIYSKL